MFADLIKRLTAPAVASGEDEDERQAMAALLVRLARSDGDYAPQEIERIERVLAGRYGLSAEAAAGLRRAGEEMEAGAPDTVRFTRAIKDSVPHEARVAVVEAAWRVALADGERAHEEDALMRLIANLLGINDRDSNLARQRVAAGE
jgi:uncharacterized tellurite resistance protein B-like protein